MSPLADHRFVSLLRRRPAYRRLWLGELVSLLGGWLSYVAVSLLALDQGEGAVDLALVLAAHTLPGVLVAPLAGVLADRLDRRAVLVGVSLAEGAVTLLLLGALVAGAPLVLLQGLVFLRSGVGALGLPASSAALRRVVEEDELLVANTLASTTWSASFAVGTALGGLLALAGPAPALAVDALSFGLAAALLAGLPALPPVATAGARVGLGDAVGPAVAALRADPALRRAALSRSTLALAGGAGWVVLNLQGAALAAGLAALGVGLLHAVRGLAMGLVPLVAEGRIARGAAPGREWVAWGSLALVGGAALALGRDGGAWVAVPAVLLWGGGTAVNWVLSGAALQRLAPPAVLGRVAAVEALTTTGGTAVGALLGAAVMDATGSVAAGGLALVLVGGVAWTTLWATTARSAPALDAGSPA